MGAGIEEVCERGCGAVRRVVCAREKRDRMSQTVGNHCFGSTVNSGIKPTLGHAERVSVGLRKSVCVCVWERAREHETVCACLYKRQKGQTQSQSVCVRECVCERMSVCARE